MHKLRDEWCAWKEDSIAWEREEGKGFQSSASVIHSQTNANAIAGKKCLQETLKEGKGEGQRTEGKSRQVVYERLGGMHVS